MGCLVVLAFSLGAGLAVFFFGGPFINSKFFNIRLGDYYYYRVAIIVWLALCGIFWTRASVVSGGISDLNIPNFAARTLGASIATSALLVLLSIVFSF